MKTALNFVTAIFAAAATASAQTSVPGINSSATIANKTLPATTVISPAAIMFPTRMVVEGDSISSAGSQYFPANFAGQPSGPTTNGDGFDSYHIVYSYTAGTPQPYEVGTGVKPLTSWPEQLSAIAGSSPTLIDFAYAGRYLADVHQCYFQEAHQVAPRFTGVPAGIHFYAGINDLSQSTTATQMWGYLQDLCAWARQDGFSPIVVYTLQPQAAGNVVGSTWDVKRLAYNADMTGSSGVADVIVDVTTIPGLAATNSPTTGQAYTHNSTNYYDGLHFSAAGNGILAAKVFSQVKSFAPLPSVATRAVPEVTYNLLSPWSVQFFRISDFLQPNNLTGSSGGDVYFGESVSVGIRNGAGSGNYSQAHLVIEMLGQMKRTGGGARQRYQMDWGHPQCVDFSFQPDWGGSGNSWPNTKWQVIFGRANGFTPGALANSDVAVGLLIDPSTVGQITLKAVVANGTTASVTSLVTIPDNGTVYGAINCQLRTDGYGNFFVTIPNASGQPFTTVLTGAPSVYNGGVSQNDQFSYEAYTTGTESSNNYIYFGPPTFSTW